MKRIIAALAALFAALALVLIAPPAQALGWSGQRCHTGSDGWKICTQTHTVAIPNNRVWVDTIQVCMTMWDPNPRIEGSFGGSWGATGGAWAGLPSTGKSDCAYANLSKAAGSVAAGACYNASGRIDRSLYPDAAWSTSGRVQGGAC